MSKNSLEVLFGSRVRIKVLKFLFRNYGRGYSLNEIARRTREDRVDVRRELQKLQEIKFVTHR